MFLTFCRNKDISQMCLDTKEIVNLCRKKINFS